MRVQSSTSKRYDKDMIKHPFTVREAMNTHLLNFIAKTAEAFKIGRAHV